MGPVWRVTSARIMLNSDITLGLLGDLGAVCRWFVAAPHRPLDRVALYPQA